MKIWKISKSLTIFNILAFITMSMFVLFGCELAGNKKAISYNKIVTTKFKITDINYIFNILDSNLDKDLRKYNYKHYLEEEIKNSLIAVKLENPEVYNKYINNTKKMFKEEFLKDNNTAMDVKFIKRVYIPVYLFNVFEGARFTFLEEKDNDLIRESMFAYSGIFNISLIKSNLIKVLEKKGYTYCGAFESQLKIGFHTDIFQTIRYYILKDKVLIFGIEIDNVEETSAFYLVLVKVNDDDILSLKNMLQQKNIADSTSEYQIRYDISKEFLKLNN